MNQVVSKLKMHRRLTRKTREKLQEQDPKKKVPKNQKPLPSAIGECYMVSLSDLEQKLFLSCNGLKKIG